MTATRSIVQNVSNEQMNEQTNENFEKIEICRKDIKQLFLRTSRYIRTTQKRATLIEYHGKAFYLAAVALDLWAS